MRELPIFHCDVSGSLLGVMLFPNDLEKAQSYAAKLLARGPLQDYLRAGYDFSQARHISLLDALSGDVSNREIATQNLHGKRVGETVKALWALICDRPDIASWDAAIFVLEDAASEVGLRAGRSTFRADLSEMRSVLHLWGAFALRDYKFLADSSVGYTGLDDLGALMTEAMALWQQLCAWRDGRNRIDDEYLSGEVFGPWADWEPHERRPGWPDTGGIYARSLPADRVPTRRRPGRRPKIRPVKN